MKQRMKKVCCLLLCLLLMPKAMTVSHAAQSDTALGILLDDCVDFSVAQNHSDGLYAEVTAEENRYAFDDFTMFMRKEKTAEWLEYEIPLQQYLIFHTYFRQNEEISHFTFSWSADGENWQEAIPEIQIETVESWKWIPVVYSLKNLDAAAKYVRITFGNLEGVEWSPSLAGVYSQYLTKVSGGFTDCAGTPYEEDTAFLKELGFVSGYNAYEYRPEEEISRAEFAKLTAGAVNAEGESVRIFYDVDSGHWVAASIAGLYGIGVISGDENGYFHPEEPITCQEAAKLMASAMGYTAMAEQRGGYPTGYLQTASRIGLLRGISRSGEEKINRGDAAVMLANLLKGEMIYPVSYGSGDNRYQQDGTTPLNFYHHIYEVKGQLSNLGAKSIGDQNILGENQAMIDGRIFYQSAGCLKDLLGQEICAYVKYEDRDTTGTILYAQPQAGTLSETFSALEYKGIEDGKLVFLRDGSEREYRYTNNTRVVYNGRFDTRMGVTEKLDVTCGSIRIVSNSGNHTADVILIEEYETDWMAAPGRLDGGLTDKKQGAVNLGLDLAQAVSVSLYGELQETYENITVQPNDVVCVAKSRDGYVADVKVLHDRRTGTLQSLRQDAGVCVLQGEELQLSKAFAPERAAAFLGKEVTAYLDLNGAVFILEENILQSGYGYLQNVAVKSGISEKVILRIVTQSALALEYTADSKTQLNGKKGSVSDFGNLTPQLIRYTAREDGTLAKVETAAEGNGIIGQSGFTLNYQSDQAKYYGDQLKVFASVYQMDADTKVFLVPEDSSRIEDYEVTNADAFITDKNYRVFLYDVDDSYRCGAVVADLAASENRTLENYDPVAIVQSVGNILDKDGNLCLEVSAKVGGEDTFLYFDSLGGRDVTGSWLPNYKSRNTADGNNPFSPGEVLQYYMDSKSHCKYFRMLLTDSMIEDGTEYEKNMGDYGALSEQNYFSELYTTQGTVLKKFSDKLLVSADSSGFVRTIPLSGAVIYRLNKENKKLLTGDASDISEGSKVFVRMNYTAVREILVISGR